MPIIHLPYSYKYGMNNPKWRAWIKQFRGLNCKKSALYKAEEAARLIGEDIEGLYTLARGRSRIGRNGIRFPVPGAIWIFKFYDGDYVHPKGVRALVKKRLIKETRKRIKGIVREVEGD